MKIKCRLCGRESKNTNKKFPIKLYGKVPLWHKGKPTGLTQNGIIGYMCANCYRKGKKAEFISQHNIIPASGQTMKSAIKEKLAALKLGVGRRILKKEIPVKKPGIINRLKERLVNRQRSVNN